MSVTLNGTAASRARVQVPAWGVWWADLVLTAEVALVQGDAATIDLSGTTLRGVVVSGGIVSGESRYRVCGGKGGWGTTLKRLAYANDLGVKAATVAQDAATSCGETIANLPTTRLGPHYVRPEGAAAGVLHDLFPRLWYVDLDGVTRVGARPVQTYTGTGTINPDPAAGVIDVVTTDLSQLVPGVIVQGSAPASDVEVVVESKRITARVYVGRKSSARLAAWAKLFDALDPRRAYRASYEYRVVQQSGERLDLQPVRSATGMPDLSHVPHRFAPGVRAKHLLGSLVLVAFVDGDPSRPCVVAGDTADSPGFVPLELDLGDQTTALGVVRLTDTVQAGPFAGVTTSASARVKASL